MLPSLRISWRRAGVHLRGDLGAAARADVFDGSVEPGAVGRARVILAGHEVHRQAAPQRIAQVIGSEHQVQQRAVSIDRKAESAQRIGLIARDVFRICAQPRIFRSAPEPPRHAAQRQLIHQPAVRARAAVHDLQNARDAERGLCLRVQSGASADDQAIDLAPILRRIGARGQRAHAVAEQEQRPAGIFCAKELRHLVHILDQPAPAVLVKVAQIARIAHARAVAAVVVDDARIAVLRQKFHHRQIALLVLRHAVRKLHQRLRLALGRNGRDGQRQSVVFRRNCEILNLRHANASSASIHRSSLPFRRGFSRRSIRIPRPHPTRRSARPTALRCRPGGSTARRRRGIRRRSNPRRPRLRGST